MPTSTAMATPSRRFLVTGADLSAQREPTADDLAGIRWWNLLDESHRAFWIRQAGSAVVADAWAAFKRRQRPATAVSGVMMPSATGTRPRWYSLVETGINDLRDEHRLILSPDNRHAPIFSCGEILVIDPSLKKPRHGDFFVIEYSGQTETGEPCTRTVIQQCRRVSFREELYLLGASAPQHRAECCDGLYDAGHFERAVLGGVVGITEASS